MPNASCLPGCVWYVCFDLAIIASSVWKLNTEDTCLCQHHNFGHGELHHKMASAVVWLQETSLHCSQKDAACVTLHAQPWLNVCVCACVHVPVCVCVCVSPFGRTPHCRDRHCSTIPPLLSCRHFTHAGANANQPWLVALSKNLNKNNEKGQKKKQRAKKRTSTKAVEVKFWLSSSGSETARFGQSGVCVCLCFEFCPCVYRVQRVQRYLRESGGGKGEQRCKKFPPPKKKKCQEKKRERNWGKWWSSANWNECNGLHTAGERQQKKGRETERERESIRERRKLVYNGFSQ